MIDRKNLVGGDLSPIDIHSEEFKKRCEARRKKTKGARASYYYK